jgi:transcription-repair coupling factor (superfamily II helicase)
MVAHSSWAAPSVAAERIAEALRRRAPLRVLGADGPLRGLCLARASSSDAAGPVVYVAADDLSARAVAADTAFFLGAPDPSEREHDGPILVVPELDVSPYADTSPDPRAIAGGGGGGGGL